MAPLVADAPATSSRARRRRPAEVSSTSAPAASAPAGVVVVSAARLFFGWRSSARVPSSWACALGGHSDLIMVAPPRPKPTPPWAFVARHRVWTPSPNVPRPPPPPLPPLPPPSCVPLRLIGFVLARCVIKSVACCCSTAGCGCPRRVHSRRGFERSTPSCSRGPQKHAALAKGIKKKHATWGCEGAMAKMTNAWKVAERRVVRDFAVGRANSSRKK
jgi:hypothetical protein